MKRPNWESATYAGDIRATDELDEADLSWLCGCGHSKPYAGSKAYPICPQCGERMRLLDHSKLGYRRGARLDPERWPDAVRMIVDQIGEATGVETVVDVQQLLMGDGRHYGWVISSPRLTSRFQLLGCEPKPEPVRTTEPAWYAKLNDLPPGGTT